MKSAIDFTLCNVYKFHHLINILFAARGYKMTLKTDALDNARHYLQQLQTGQYKTSNLLKVVMGYMDMAGLDPQTDEAWKAVGVKAGLRGLAVLERRAYLKEAQKAVSILFQDRSADTTAVYMAAAQALEAAGFDVNSDKAWKRAGVPAGLNGLELLMKGRYREDAAQNVKNMLNTGNDLIVEFAGAESRLKMIGLDTSSDEAWQAAGLDGGMADLKKVLLVALAMRIREKNKWGHVEQQEAHTINYIGHYYPELQLEAVFAAAPVVAGVHSFTDPHYFGKYIQDVLTPADKNAPLVIEGLVGDEFKDTVRSGRALNAATGRDVAFNFNGTDLVVNKDSDADQLFEFHMKECARRRQEYLNSPEGIADAAEAERERLEELRREQEVAEKVSGGTIELRNKRRWKQYVAANMDSCGSSIIRYAERWAKLMQVEMAAGAKLEDIAEKTSHDADNEGMSGLSHSAALVTLAHCWKHGDQLYKLLSPSYQKDMSKAAKAVAFLKLATLEAPQVAAIAAKHLRDAGENPGASAAWKKVGLEGGVAERNKLVMEGVMRGVAEDFRLAAEGLFEPDTVKYILTEGYKTMHLYGMDLRTTEAWQAVGFKNVGEKNKKLLKKGGPSQA